VSELPTTLSGIRRGGTRDNPWFVARDVCDVLGIENARDALGRIDADKRGGVLVDDTTGRKQRTAILYESGLYALIFSFHKEQAKAFRKWVTCEVLPSIRKTGSYQSKRREKYE
jgi:prophage antirepressor-like protein